MPPAHRKPSKNAEKRRQRRQRREGQAVPRRGGEAPRIAPLQLDPRKSTPVSVSTPTAKLEADTEYAIVRRDLWRLTLYSVICFVLMITVLLMVNA